MKYKTLSKTHGVKDKNIIKILDYIERQTKGNCFKNSDNSKMVEYIMGDVSLTFRIDGIIEVCKVNFIPDEMADNQTYTLDYEDDFIFMDIGIFAENVVWLYGSIRNFKS